MSRNKCNTSQAVTTDAAVCMEMAVSWDDMYVAKKSSVFVAYAVVSCPGSFWGDYARVFVSEYEVSGDHEEEESDGEGGAAGGGKGAKASGAQAAKGKEPKGLKERMLAQGQEAKALAGSRIR
ncbi:hypothetical protein FOA52_006438 [Chlamydomonas sp. UWO 241]|nr:hypothetical protein FOA52_006438 [Chlamydomonas sp. UWO 241]